LDKIAFIFARGGSKGIRDKNLAPIGKDTLIGHTLKFAHQSELFSAVYVSTDSELISEHVLRFKDTQVIERPPDLATDTSPELLSWKHAVSHVSPKHDSNYKFVSLSCTAPLRSVQSVVRGVDALSNEIDLVISMSPSSRNPWFNMVRKSDNHIVRVNSGESQIYRRQDAPQTYDLTTAFYISWPAYVLACTTLWDGRVHGVEIPVEESIDIDTQYDLEIANYLVNRR